MTIAAKLIKAQAAAKSVKHDGHNTHQGYRYTSAEALIDEARACLLDAGLLLTLRAAKIVRLDGDGYSVTTHTRSGDWTFTVRAHLACTWVIADDSEVWELTSEWPIIPENGRPYDKATAAARTASLGYLLRDLLLLPRGEDGTGLDDERRDHGNEKPRAPAKPAAPKPAPKADEKPAAEKRTPEQSKAIRDLIASLKIEGPALQEVGKLAGDLDPQSKAGSDAIITALSARGPKPAAGKRHVILRFGEALRECKNQQAVTDACLAFAKELAASMGAREPWAVEAAAHRRSVLAGEVDPPMSKPAADFWAAFSELQKVQP